MAQIVIKCYPETLRRWKKALKLLNKRGDSTLNYLLDLLDALQLDKRPKTPLKPNPYKPALLDE